MIMYEKPEGTGKQTPNGHRVRSAMASRLLKRQPGRKRELPTQHFVVKHSRKQGAAYRSLMSTWLHPAGVPVAAGA